MPFESQPHIAVAVSGGADSMALTLLADEWARRRCGTVTAITVDHGLREESAAEAAQVKDWLGARGIAHVMLRWEGAKPATGLMAAARQARYRLLTEWCRERGVLHLLVAHTLEDQAETFLDRLSRGSGVYGLAAMAPVVVMPHLRLLRPLLATPKPRLRTLLEQAGQSWVEDPSNRNMAYKRPRLRGLLPLLAAEGLAPPVLAEAAHRLAATRLALEEDAAALLARACALYPEGYARLKAEAFAAAPWETAYRALAFLLERVGGGEKELRRAALEPVCAALRAGRVEKNLTLHGCVLSPARRQKEKGQLLLLRELAAVEGAAALVPGGTIVWDGRFQLRLAPDAPPGLWVAALGVEEAVEIHKQHLGVTIPKRVLATLPCIRWRVAGIDKVVAVPHLGVWRDIGVKPSAVTLGFSPPKAFARPGFSYILPTSTQALRGACE